MKLRRANCVEALMDRLSQDGERKPSGWTGREDRGQAIDQTGDFHHSSGGAADFTPDDGQGTSLIRR